MIVVTGAAGFVGSNLVKALNDRGETDIIAVDNLTNGDKFRNLVDCQIADYLDKEEFLRKLSLGAFDEDISVVLHQGACSNTMEGDGRYMMENNYRYSAELLDFCQSEEVPFIYASSAAVYGGGSTFREDPQFERPLNVYGYSKFLFDSLVRRRWGDNTAQVIGLRYFNVYGPREAHKGIPASMVLHLSRQIKEGKRPRIFKHGEQKRDFVYVKDIVEGTLRALEANESGIYNLGSGQARSFNELIAVLNHSLGTNFEAEYFDNPHAHYQNHTEADLTNVRKALGYEPQFSLEAGVADYMRWLYPA